MSDAPPPVRAATPSTVPLKRPLEDDHAPSISSPLNPNAAASTKQPIVREKREKKDSLKKREAAGLVNAKGSTSEHAAKKQKLSDDTPAQPSPTRYNHPLPKEGFHYHIKQSAFSSHEPEPFYAPNGVELKRPADHAENKKNYRYVHCVADPLFTHSRYYRQSDSKPFGPRMSFEDSDKWLHFNETGTMVTNEKGWRMGRANICAREGTFYYEVKILRGVPREGPPVPADSTLPQPHIRMGWARREAPLDSPVGFDGYSYGVSDIRLDPMHKSRAGKFTDDDDKAGSKKSKSKSSKTPGTQSKGLTEGFNANDHAREGDVIGLEITLPSLSLHRKIVEGDYNPAVDVGSGLDESTISINAEGAPNIVRDRFPVPYKGSMYFESLEYRAQKGMETYGDRGPFAKETPSPNHTDPTLRSLPHSSIKVYKNGKKIGTAFRNLMAFLPPASQPEQQKGVRMGLDDGMLGYFPAISSFWGGIAECNFGPDFWFPPPGMAGAANDADGDAAMTDGATKQQTEEEAFIAGSGAWRSKSRPIGDRYAEQIAEDVVYDLIDEIDFFMQDGGAGTSG